MSGLNINELFTPHLEYIGRVRPPVNFLLNPKVESALLIKARSPESKLIGRPYLPDGEVHQWYLRPGTVEGARAAGNRAADYCMAQGVQQVDAWQLINESPVASMEQIRLLAEFDGEFARALHRSGSRACIGTFSRGTPQIPREDGGAALSAYIPALRVAHEVGAWLAIHQYGKYPLLADSEHLALRWQIHILPWYRAQGVPIPRYVITECGVDLGTGNIPQDGWRGTPYASAEQEYGQHLLQLMREYMRDPFCIGATVFCAGRAGWDSFSVDGPLLDYLATLPWPKPATVVQPVPAQPEVPVTTIPAKPFHDWQPSPNFTPNRGIPKDTIVYHHTAPGDALSWLRNSASGVSCQYLVMKTGKIYQLVADVDIAWHAGYSLMPDGRENVNNFSFGIEIENDGDGQDPYPPIQIDAVVALARYLVAKYNIKREKNVTHELIRRLWKEKYPGRTDDLGRPVSFKTDPRGLDMTKLLNRVYAVPAPAPVPTAPNSAVLIAEANRQQVLRFNPSAALQKAIFQHGFVPNSPEFGLNDGGVTWVCQRAERLSDGAARVYYARQGDWGNVKYVEARAA